MALKGHKRDHDDHRVLTISYRGKSDSVYAECACGFSDYIAVWYDKPPPGWDEAQWPKLIKSIATFLASFRVFSPAERIGLDIASRKIDEGGFNSAVKKALMDLFKTKAEICDVLLFQTAVKARYPAYYLKSPHHALTKSANAWLKKVLGHPKRKELEECSKTQFRALVEIDAL